MNLIFHSLSVCFWYQCGGVFVVFVGCFPQGCGSVPDSFLLLSSLRRSSVFLDSVAGCVRRAETDAEENSLVAEFHCEGAQGSHQDGTL